MLTPVQKQDRFIRLQISMIRISTKRKEVGIMEKKKKGLTRRESLKVIGAGAGLLAMGFPIKLEAQEPIRLGTLCPLTGAGGPYGPQMEEAMTRVVKEINESGGIHGHQIQLFHEDSQTNPEAAVRAAHKLIEVNKVNAIMGTWASAVTLAIAPICYNNKVFDISVSGADAISGLKDDDYIFRTQPNTFIQSEVYGRFALERKWKKMAYMAVQTPYAKTFGDTFKKTVEAGGATVVEYLIYEANKPSYRSELTKVLASKPEDIVTQGYSPDSIILFKELFKMGFKGRIVGPGFAINQKVVDSVGAEVAEGIYILDPGTDPQSPAYKNLVRLLGTTEINSYAAQTYDHINLVALSLWAGKVYTGTGIRDHIRTISNPPGVEVGSFQEGMKGLREGKKINYQGASGAADFDEKGDILSRPFMFSQVKSGKIVSTGWIKG
jgi:branched-chain amino acid transport system substrate-binding protein